MSPLCLRLPVRTAAQYESYRAVPTDVTTYRSSSLRGFCDSMYLSFRCFLQSSVYTTTRLRTAPSLLSFQYCAVYQQLQYDTEKCINPFAVSLITTHSLHSENKTLDTVCFVSLRNIISLWPSLLQIIIIIIIIIIPPPPAPPFMACSGSEF
jgi:hypothetical protein